jgi:hypothetical protein
VAGRPFEYYLASANGDYPKAASLLASDFNEFWWSSDEYKLAAERDKGKISDNTSALRLEISRYLTTLDQAKAVASAYGEEISMLAGLNVDGVITTNWDLLLEQMFPGYRVYIGQQELLFSNPQQIGEIYKIHGCATKPGTLVLTHEDYALFNERNSYLAAKLITIFVEHPVVFIGYSLSDPNITSLLRALSLCIGREQIEQLRRNLIFVRRPSASETEGISETYLTIDGVQIPIVMVTTDDFRPLYSALGEVKRKIPARILRYCKEQLYALVASEEPEKKLCVVDLDEVDRNDEVEFVVGVGVARGHNSKDIDDVGAVGYAAIESDDLFHDLLHENRGYSADAILKQVIKKAGRNTRNIPVFKYLHESGVRTAEDYANSGLELGKWVARDLKDFRLKVYQQGFFKFRHLPMEELIAATTAENASGYIPCLSREKIDVGLLREFLRAHQDKLFTKGPYQSNFRKLASLYDRLRWGW